MTNISEPNRLVPPQLHLIEEVNFLTPNTVTLSNGMPVYLQKGGSQDIVKFEMVFKSGSVQQEKPLQAYAMAHLLKSGTQQKNAIRINELWDFYGASMQIDAQKDIISVGFLALARHLPQTLALLFEMLSQPIFPEEELTTFLANRKQKHMVDVQKVQYMARVHFASLVYGNIHPYGRSLVADDFDNLTREDLVSFYGQHIHPENCVCFVSGNYPADIVAFIEKNLTAFQWTAGSKVNGTIPGINPSPEKRHHLTREDAVQSAIRIGKGVVGRTHPDNHKLKIANSLLGGYFGSRLMQNIRQDKGYTYGINSAIVNLLQSAYFFISSQVGKEVAAPALEEVYKELRNLYEKPASDTELDMLRNYLSANFLRSFDGPFLQAERFKEILLFGQDYNYYNDYLNALKTITAKQIQEVAFLHLHPDQMTELIVG